MQKIVNLIAPKENKRLLKYLALDILLMLIIALAISFMFSKIHTDNSKTQQQIINYENKQISNFRKRTKDYNKLKIRRDNTLKIAKSYVAVQEYQYKIIHGIQNISSIIPNDLLISNLKYNISSKKDNITINGETTNLELISVFLEKLKTVFPEYKIHLEKLDAIRQNSKNRIFIITITENNNKKSSKKVSS